MSVQASPERSLRILLIGPEYHGSDSGSLGRAFRRAGHVVAIVDPESIALRPRFSFTLRVVNKLCARLYLQEVGRHVVKICDTFKPDLCVVYKGNMFPAWALCYLKQRGVYCVNVYPDVSFLAHGPEIPECLPLYDHIFTTKTFGMRDLRDELSITKSEFLPHGFDPDLHRPIEPNQRDLENFGSDASFIGTWSPKKECYLDYVASHLPEIRLRVWGSFWNQNVDFNKRLVSSITGRIVVGDLYPLCMACSKINIAILSEKRVGSSSGDLTTSRTFHITAAGGFMLHERTDELLQFYAEGKEVACFSDPSELVEKIKYYLIHEEEREEIRLAGYQRCVSQYSLDNHARRIVEYFHSRVI